MRSNACDDGPCAAWLPAGLVGDAVPWACAETAAPSSNSAAVAAVRSFTQRSFTSHVPLFESHLERFETPPGWDDRCPGLDAAIANSVRLWPLFPRIRAMVRHVHLRGRWAGLTASSV